MKVQFILLLSLVAWLHTVHCGKRCSYLLQAQNTVAKAFQIIIIVVLNAHFLVNFTCFLLYPDETGTCLVKGDPHISQFDADHTQHDQNLFIKRTCTYLLVQHDCTLSSWIASDFYIKGSFERVNPAHNRSKLHELVAQYTYGRQFYVSVIQIPIHTQPKC